MSWNDQALTTVLPGEALLKMPIPRRQVFDWLCFAHTMAEGGGGGEDAGSPTGPTGRERAVPAGAGCRADEHCTGLVYGHITLNKTNPI